MAGKRTGRSALVGLIMGLGLYGGSYQNSAIASAATSAPNAVTISTVDYQFPDTLNPYQSNSIAAGKLSGLLFAPLITFDNLSRPFGVLATHAPLKENGLAVTTGKQLNVTVSIRSGARWSDGQLITSEDIRFGWEVGMAPSTGYCAGSCDAIASIDTPKPEKAVIHFQRAPADYLLRFPDVLPTHAFSSVADATEKLFQTPTYNFESTDYVTSGPYQVSAVVPNDRITFTPNPQYHILVGPYLSSIAYAYFASKSDLIAAAGKRDVDVAGNLTKYDLPSLASQLKPSMIHVQPGDAATQLVFNTGVTPLNGQKMRQALSLAIDTHAQCMAVWGLDSATCSTLAQRGPLPPTSALNTVPLVPQANIARARQLLKTSGYHNQPIGFTVTRGNVPRKAYAENISQIWRSIGVNVSTPEYVSFSKFYGAYADGGTLAAGQFQVTLLSLSYGLDPNALNYAYQSSYIPSATRFGANYGRVSDSVLDSLLNAANNTVDQKQRRKLYATATQRIVDQAYMIGLVNDGIIYTSDGVLGNYYPEPQSDSWNAFEWYSTTTHKSPPPAWNTSIP